MLTLRVRLVDSGLVGGVREYAPSLAHWGSWGAHRLAQRTPLRVNDGLVTVCGPYVLPTLQSVRGDEHLWFKLLAKTRVSGVPAIDAVEQRAVERDLQAGIGDLSLLEALHAARTGTPCAVELQEVLLAAHWRSLGQQQPDATLKGVLEVRAEVTQDPGLKQTTAVWQRLGAALEANAAGRGPLLYNTPSMVQAMVHMRDLLVNTYAPAFYGLDSAQGERVQAPQWPVGMETSLDNLHLALYRAEQGVLPPIAFFLHDVATRDWPAGSDVAQHAATYALTPSSARFMERLLAASLRRKGLSAEAFLASINAQLARSHSDPSVSPGYLDALDAIQDLGTYVANALHYTCDMRYARDTRAKAAHSQRALKLSPADALACKLTLGKMAWPLHVLLGEDAPGAGGDKKDAVIEGPAPVEIESFDANAIYGLVNSGDCEDMSNLGSTVLRQVPAAAALGGAQTPLLQAAARVCATRIVFDVAGSVTGAYVNTEGKELSKDEMKAVTDLPRIGDAMDQRAHLGGHCHGVWESKAGVCERLVRAGVPVEKDLPALWHYAQNAGAWEYQQPALVLEGTSSIEPWVLPAGEVARFALGSEDRDAAALFEARAASRRALVKHARAAAPALFEAFKLEGLSFYTAPLPADERDRRVSAFYRGLVHLVAPELYAMNPLYGQVTAVQLAVTAAVGGEARGTRGVEMGAYLRAAVDPHTTVAMIPTFGALGREAWETQVRPMMACVQNQMPLNAFARFDNAAASTLATLRNDHVLGHDGQVLSTLHGAAAPAALGDTQEVAMKAHSDTNTAALCLYTQPWRVTEHAQLDAELAALVASGHVLSYTMVHDQPLGCSDDVLCLQLTLPVAAAPGAATTTRMATLLDASVPAWASYVPN